MSETRQSRSLGNSVKRPNGQTPRRTQPPHCAQSTENMTVPQSPPPTRRPGRGCRVSVVSRPARARGRRGAAAGASAGRCDRCRGQRALSKPEGARLPVCVCVDRFISPCTSTPTVCGARTMIDVIQGEAPRGPHGICVQTPIKEKVSSRRGAATACDCSKDCSMRPHSRSRQTRARALVPPFPLPPPAPLPPPPLLPRASTACSAGALCLTPPL